MDSMETENAENNGLPQEGEKVIVQADVERSIKSEESTELPEAPPPDKDEITEPVGLENGEASGSDFSCNKEALTLEAGLNRTESMTSSVSDSPSSTGSVCENKLACTSQDLIDHNERDSIAPTGEHLCPVVTEERDSPVSTDKRNSQIPTDERVSHVPADENVCPAVTAERDSPVSMEERDSHIPKDERDSPVPADEKVCPIDTDKRDRPVPADEKGPVPADENVCPILTEERDRPVPADENVCPIVTEERDRPVPADENVCPIDTEEKDSPVSIAERESHIPTEARGSPVPTVEKACPVVTGERDIPVPTGDAKDHMITEVSEGNESALDDNETHDVTKENAIQQETEEPIFKKCTREDASSDISNESCHLDQDDLSDCLQVEIAIVSSDSESDDKWRTIFSSSINKDEGNDIYLDNSQDTKTQEHFVQDSASAEDVLTDLEQKTEALIEDSMGILEHQQPCSEFEAKTQEHPSHLLTPFHGLSKISEDEEEVTPNLAKRRMYTINSARSGADKKVPSDYCVIQETKSENVSTEHVDFRVARKQWLKMEEQTKQQVVQPIVKQGTCQGGHSLMYTPVRNIEKPKKDPEQDNLALKELTYTQFSPCSEDSGLDDSSYRSPYDEPETPIEREIRLAMEREESLRRERGLPISPSANIRPATLFTGKFNKPEERRKSTDVQEDSCRSQRSPSAKTPSFSVASSPSSKGPMYHEMAANNVIILEPDPSSLSKRHSSPGPLNSPSLKKFSEWPSDTTNIIILETSNLIIRSASEFCLNTVCQDAQESTFVNNPFFKLRSRSTQSLVDQEIKIVKQREEELKRQRARLYPKEKYDTVLVSPNLVESITFDKSELPVRCKSSPSSPLRTTRKMDRSAVSCDHKFTDTFSGVRRKSAMALRWEAGEFANHQQE